MRVKVKVCASKTRARFNRASFICTGPEPRTGTGPAKKAASTKAVVAEVEAQVEELRAEMIAQGLHNASPAVSTASPHI